MPLKQIFGDTLSDCRFTRLKHLQITSTHLRQVLNKSVRLDPHVSFSPVPAPQQNKCNINVIDSDSRRPLEHFETCDSAEFWIREFYSRAYLSNLKLFITLM